MHHKLVYMSNISEQTGIRKAWLGFSHFVGTVGHLSLVRVFRRSKTRNSNFTNKLNHFYCVTVSIIWDGLILSVDPTALL